MPQELELVKKPKGLELPANAPPSKRGDSPVLDFISGFLSGPDLFSPSTERPPMDAQTIGELLSMGSVGSLRKIPQVAGQLDNVIDAGKRVAPKRAALELAKLLEGRSERVPHVRTPYNWTEEDAVREALQTSRVTSQSRPPKPTQIRVDKGPYLKPTQVTLSRDPLLQQLYRRFATWAGKKAVRDPDYYDSKYISQYIDPPKNTIIGPERPFATMGRVSGESVQEALTRKKPDITKPSPMTKVLTISEMRSLVEGPKRALRMGGISSEEANRLIKIGRRKIDDYLNTLQQLDKERQLEQLRKAMPNEFK